MFKSPRMIEMNYDANNIKFDKDKARRGKTIISAVVKRDEKYSWPQLIVKNIPSDAVPNPPDDSMVILKDDAVIIVKALQDALKNGAFNEPELAAEHA